MSTFGSLIRFIWDYGKQIYHFLVLYCSYLGNLRSWITSHAKNKYFPLYMRVTTFSSQFERFFLDRHEISNFSQEAKFHYISKKIIELFHWCLWLMFQGLAS